MTQADLHNCFDCVLSPLLLPDLILAYSFIFVIMFQDRRALKASSHKVATVNLNLLVLSLDF